MDSIHDPLAVAVAPELRERFLHGIVRAAATQVEGFAEGAAEPWRERAVSVLSANLAAGRCRLLEPEGAGAPTLLAYARQVLAGLLAEWELIERLRAGDSAAWAAARDRLERLAYHWLGPGGRQEWAAWEAREVAAKTSADLWLWLQTHTFPFDVPFDRWAARALTYRLHEATRRRNARSQYESDSLDRPVFDRDVTLGETLAEHSIERWFEAAGNREILLQAIGQLEERSATVLRLWYLEGWAADEIAAALGLTLNNVYVNRFRAIEKLRKLLLQDERFGLAEALRRVEANKRRLPPDAGSLESEAPHGP